jgi:DNA-binding CsgD family transcriptional regulator
MSRELVRRLSGPLTAAAGKGDDWISFATTASHIIGRHIAFDRCCWHSVDPGTVLFTGTANQNVGCSGTWLAEHEYVIEDVNKWWFLARSGRLAGASSIATHGDLNRSPRHRSQSAYGIGDELRGSFVLDGIYWGAVGFLRNEGEPTFTLEEVSLLESLSPILAEGFRRALIAPPAQQRLPDDDVPGVVVFDASGAPESVSPAAERWIAELAEDPAPATPAQSFIVEQVATTARSLPQGHDPLGLAARIRVRTTTGRWLLMYGTRLAGDGEGRTAVIIQAAPQSEIVPIIELAYGLTARERQISQLCLQGLATKAIASALRISQYTVQDHLKAIFDKTGARSRGELVGRIFLEHYVPRWEPLSDAADGWLNFKTPSSCDPENGSEHRHEGARRTAARRGR